MEKVEIERRESRRRGIKREWRWRVIVAEREPSGVSRRMERSRRKKTRIKRRERKRRKREEKAAEKGELRERGACGGGLEKESEAEGAERGEMEEEWKDMEENGGRR